MQYGDDIDKLFTHTMDRNIGKSGDDQNPSAGDDTGTCRIRKAREPSNALYNSGHGPAGSCGIISCNVTVNLFKMTKGARLVSDIHFVR
jgi:hypothetical protein